MYILVVFLIHKNQNFNYLVRVQVKSTLIINFYKYYIYDFGIPVMSQ